MACMLKRGLQATTCTITPWNTSQPGKGVVDCTAQLAFAPVDDAPATRARRRRSPRAPCRRRGPGRSRPRWPGPSAWPRSRPPSRWRPPPPARPAPRRCAPPGSATPRLHTQSCQVCRDSQARRVPSTWHRVTAAPRLGNTFTNKHQSYRVERFVKVSGVPNKGEAPDYASILCVCLPGPLSARAAEMALGRFTHSLRACSAAACMAQGMLR